MQLDPVFGEAYQSLNHIVIGKQQQLRLALTCILAQGHLLIEDLPGMGKTTLSHGLANVLGLKFNRVQFTSDMLPADLLGVNLFNSESRRFEYHPGPVFSQVLLADEINRASPKTQSALLEAMEEQQVSIDGETHPLPTPFVVIATQNPLHHAGTYPLPESQLDRFLMRIELGYPDWQSERAMLMNEDQGRPRVNQHVSHQQLIDAQQQVDSIITSEKIVDYILRLVTNSREHPDIDNPLSPRASKALLKASRAHALLSGRDHVIPDDVQAVFAAVCEHRMRSTHADISGNSSLSDSLLNAVNPLQP